MKFINNIFKGLKRENQKSLKAFIHKTFKIKLKDITLYQQAFTHKSISAEFNNERLEFLGDSILSGVINTFLYKKYPKKNEGELSKIASKLVSRDHLNVLGKKLELEKHIKYVTHKNGHKNIIGNVLESLIGAIYLDQGFITTQKIIKKHILKKHVSLSELEYIYKDYKSLLLIWGQRNKKDIAFETKKLHQKNTFEITLLIDKKVITKATAQSKKKAEQKVAKEAFLAKAIS